MLDNLFIIFMVTIVALTLGWISHMQAVNAKLCEDKGGVYVNSTTCFSKAVAIKIR